MENNKLSDKITYHSNKKISGINLSILKKEIILKISYLSKLDDFFYYAVLEFDTALQDFLILKKIMEKNNGK